jgi:hypothetical protein
MWKSIAATAIGVLAVSAPSRAAILTYQGSGSVTGSTTGTNVASGTPFTVTFSYDTSATGTLAGSQETYALPASFQLTVAGVTINAAAVTTDTLRIGNSGNVPPRADLILHYRVTTFNQSGQTISPIDTAVHFSKAGPWPSLNLTQLPTLNLSDYPIESDIQLATGFLGPAAYFFTGANQVSLAGAPGGAVLDFQLTSLSLVPEPSTVILATLGGLALLTFRRR